MKYRRLPLLCAVLLSAATARAEPVPEAVQAAVRQELQDLALPGLALETLTFAPAPQDPNFYQTVAATYVFQVSADGGFVLRNYYFAEQAIDAAQQRTARRQALAALDTSGLTVFSPADAPRYVLTVFSDAACSFCAKFHREVPALVAAGVEVRYIGYPRNGLDSPGYLLNTAVWCSADRRAAFAEAFAGGYPAADDCDTPLAAYYELGESFAVQGTPALVFEDGSLYTGYYESAAILDYLNGVAPLTVPVR